MRPAWPAGWRRETAPPDPPEAGPAGRSSRFVSRTAGPSVDLHATTQILLTHLEVLDGDPAVGQVLVEPGELLEQMGLVFGGLDNRLFAVRPIFPPGQAV